MGKKTNYIRFLSFGEIETAVVATESVPVTKIKTDIAKVFFSSYKDTVF